MKVLCVLVLALILFEGFVDYLCDGGNVPGTAKTQMIQCDGGNVSDTANCESAITEACSKQSELPTHLIAEILFRAGFETTKNAAQAGMWSREAFERIFEDYIIFIDIKYLVEKREEIIAYEIEGKLYLQIHSYRTLMNIFEHFGKNVRKIHLHYYIMDDAMRRDINENIIKKYANQLTELEMYTFWLTNEENDQIWQEISNENGDIHFPKVKVFGFRSRITKKPFDVSTIFPNLEMCEFDDVDDINFMANVRQLKELTLSIGYLKEEQLVNIIENNKQLTKLFIRDKQKITKRTLRSIDENLKNLKILKVKDLRDDFFVPTNNKVYNLTSVISFSFFGRVEDLYENVSFDMPNLEYLELNGDGFNHQITNFINRFNKLQTVYVLGLINEESTMKCIESLIHVKAFATQNSENIRMSSLEAFFKKFNETQSNLNTLTLFNFDDSKYPSREAKMKELNNHLKQRMKPTWKISYGSVDPPIIFKGDHYLMFQRDP